MCAKNTSNSRLLDRFILLQRYNAQNSKDAICMTLEESIAFKANTVF